jgi:hypothetical protein
MASGLSLPMLYIRCDTLLAIWRSWISSAFLDVSVEQA